MATSALDHSRNLRGRGFFLTDRDSTILKFIWRWKAAGTATIHDAIVRPSSAYAAYKALERLEAYGYIECARNDEHRYSAWQLTEKGFLSIRESLGELTEEGYLSENPWHDRNALAFHLGEWSTWQFPNVKLCTEQELRRRHEEDYPAWVPTAKGHRPDGYTRIESGRKSWLLAFEAELVHKSVARYESTLRHYRMLRQVDRVFWMVGSADVKSQILRARACVQDESDDFHLFVDAAEYRASGWNARVTNERSKTLFTMRGTMGEMLGGEQGRCLGVAGPTRRPSVHFDPFKIIGKSRACVTTVNLNSSD